MSLRVPAGRRVAWLLLASAVAFSAGCGTAAGQPRGAASSKPAEPAGPAARVTAAAAVSARAGWLAGYLSRGSGGYRTQLWHTANGGRTWQAQWQGTGYPAEIIASGPERWQRTQP